MCTLQNQLAQFWLSPPFMQLLDTWEAFQFLYSIMSDGVMKLTESNLHGLWRLRVGSGYGREESLSLCLASSPAASPIIL